MSNIPEARRLIAVAMKNLEHAIELMKRPTPVRRAPRNPRARLTAEKATSIRSYARKHPRAPYKRIANRFGVDAGRVSEVLTGQRFGAE